MKSKKPFTRELWYGATPEEKAKAALQQNNCIVSITEVVGIAISDEPGSLSGVMELLYANGINVEYMYAFISRDTQKAYVILRVADNDVATKALLDKGVTLLDENGFYGLMK